MGQQWRAEFPNLSNEEIRKFLIIFVDAFMFKHKDKLKFEPSDKILEIYKSIYPNSGGADQMEFEFFSDDIKETYDVALNKVWHDNITLGELLSVCVAP
ncbi:hypothetical protein TYM08_P1563 [Marinicellulosiphila megalodicopiae]